MRYVHGLLRLLEVAAVNKSKYTTNSGTGVPKRRGEKGALIGRCHFDLSSSVCALRFFYFGVSISLFPFPRFHFGFSISAFPFGRFHLGASISELSLRRFHFGASVSLLRLKAREVESVDAWRNRGHAATREPQQESRVRRSCTFLAEPDFLKLQCVFAIVVG